MNIFNAGDILQFAIRIEEDGEMFYHKTALNTESREVRDFFNQMADEEARHKTVFEGMLKGIDVNPPAESFRGEYAAYLRDFIDGKVVRACVFIRGHYDLVPGLKGFRQVADNCLRAVGQKTGAVEGQNPVQVEALRCEAYNVHAVITAQELAEPCRAPHVGCLSRHADVDVESIHHDISVLKIDIAFGVMR